MAITKCPHCESSAFIRDSVQQSSLVRTAVGVCKDPYCGHTFKITISVDYSLSPSGKPNPRVNLPLSSKLHSSQVKGLKSPEFDLVIKRGLTFEFVTV